MALGFGDVAIVYSKVMFEMSYKYISSSNTTASRFRFNLTASTADGKVSSQIIDDLYRSMSIFDMALRAGMCFGATLPLYFV